MSELSKKLRAVVEAEDLVLLSDAVKAADEIEALELQLRRFAMAIENYEERLGAARP